MYLVFGQYLRLSSVTRHACLRLRRLRATKEVPYVFSSRRRFSFTRGGAMAPRRKDDARAKHWRRVNNTTQIRVFLT
jgi:hypothetical protein